MSMFDGILGNIDEMAAKLGLPADQVHAMVASVKDKIGEGGNPMAALGAVAQEHGLSMESLQGLMASGGAQDMLAKLGGALDKDGDGSPLDDIGGMVKGLFGKD